MTMTSLIKEGTGTIRHLGSTILNQLMNVFHFTQNKYKSRSRDLKFDLCMIEYLLSKKNCKLLNSERNEHF